MVIVYYAVCIVMAVVTAVVLAVCIVILSAAIASRWSYSGCGYQPLRRPDWESDDFEPPAGNTAILPPRENRGQTP